MSTMRHKSLSDCLSIAALRRTEILEYGMIKQLQAAVMSATITTSSTQQHDDGIMALGKSISGIFGWSSSSNNSSGGGRLATSGHSQDPSLVNNNNYQGSNYATAAINAALDPTFKHKLLRCLRVHLSSSSSIIIIIRAVWQLVAASSGSDRRLPTEHSLCVGGRGAAEYGSPSSAAEVRE